MKRIHNIPQPGKITFNNDVLNMLLVSMWEYPVNYFPIYFDER